MTDKKPEKPTLYLADPSSPESIADLGAPANRRRVDAPGVAGDRGSAAPRVGGVRRIGAGSFRLERWSRIVTSPGRPWWQDPRHQGFGWRSGFQTVQPFGKGTGAHLHLVPQTPFGRLDRLGDDALHVRKQDVAVEPREYRNKVLGHEPDTTSGRSS